MSVRQDSSRKLNKYLFDLHNFDDQRVEEPVEPPPPVYSEQELEAAKKESFEQGKRTGLAEAKVSREKHVADLLGNVKQSFTALFAAETKRASAYEEESLLLARAVLARLFPALNERQGLEEIVHVVAGVLESHRNLPEIVVEVHPDYAEDVRWHISGTLKGLQNMGVCTVAGNLALGPGDCRMAWNEGGAERAAVRLAEQIDKVLQQALAGQPGLRDNGDKDNEPGNAGDGP